MKHEFMVGGIKLLEFLFAAGLVGSLVLIVITTVEDFRELFTRGGAEEPELLNGD